MEQIICVQQQYGLQQQMILCTVLAFTLYPLLIFIFTRLNPFKFAKKIAKVALFGAATQSSAATLPA